MACSLDMVPILPVHSLSKKQQFSGHSVIEAVLSLLKILNTKKKMQLVLKKKKTHEIIWSDYYLSCVQ